MLLNIGIISGVLGVKERTLEGLVTGSRSARSGRIRRIEVVGVRKEKDRFAHNVGIYGILVLKAKLNPRTYKPQHLVP